MNIIYYLLVVFGSPGPMENVASGVIIPEVFISILSPSPDTKWTLLLSPPNVPFFTMYSILNRKETQLV